MPGSRAAAWVAGTLDRHVLAVLVLLSAAFFYSAGHAARGKPFWHDEIYTILLTGLPSLSTMWAAMQDGMDLSPPLNALLTRGVRALAGVGPIAMRLVPMIGFWGMSVLLYVMVRRRANATIALTAALLPMFTAAYRHAYEARAYGLMMAFFALALYAWSEAAAGRRRGVNLVLLAVALAAGLWNHYYAVVAYVPVAAGEAVRTLRTRRVDRGVAAATLVSAAAAAPMLLLLRGAAAQTSTFWSPASLADIRAAYVFVLDALLTSGFLAAASIVLVLAASGRLWSYDRLSEARRLPPHEVAAGIAAVLAPAAAVLLGVLVTGVFVPRYALPGVVGVGLAAPLAIWFITRHARVAELVLPALLVFTLAGSLGSVSQRPHPLDARPALRASLESSGPTVVTGGLTYLQLWYYTPPELRSRLVYVADPEHALRYTGSNTVDLGYLALARWTPVSVVEYEVFIERYSEFRVYAYGSGWLLEKVRDAGLLVEEIGGDPGAPVFYVRPPA